MAKFQTCMISLTVLALVAPASSASAKGAGEAAKAFFSTLTSTMLPPIAQPAPNAVGALVTNRTPPLTAKAQPDTQEAPKAALAYTVLRVDANKAVTIAQASDTYKPGEGVVIAVTNNVPGVLDVDNIDAKGKRETLETVAFGDLKQLLLPAKEEGFYIVNADSDGAETLELRFFPCTPTGKQLESMSAMANKVVAQLAAATLLKTETVKALGACPTKAERDAVKSVRTESMGVVANSAVAAAAKTLAEAAKAKAPTPVIVSIRIERAK